MRESKSGERRGEEKGAEGEGLGRTLRWVVLVHPVRARDDWMPVCV